MGLSLRRTGPGPARPGSPGSPHPVDLLNPWGPSREGGKIPGSSPPPPPGLAQSPGPHCPWLPHVHLSSPGPTHSVRLRTSLPGPWGAKDLKESRHSVLTKTLVVPSLSLAMSSAETAPRPGADHSRSVPREVVPPPGPETSRLGAQPWGGASGIVLSVRISCRDGRVGRAMLRVAAASPVQGKRVRGSGSSVRAQRSERPSCTGLGFPTRKEGPYGPTSRLVNETLRPEHSSTPGTCSGPHTGHRVGQVEAPIAFRGSRKTGG